MSLLSTSARLARSAVAIGGALSALWAQSVFAQCPTKIPSTVVSSVTDPTVRVQAAGASIDAAFIAQNGGALTMIEQIRAQLATYDAAIAQSEEAIRRLSPTGTVPPVGVAGRGDNMMSAHLTSLSAARDQKRLAEATLGILQCWAARALGSQGGPGSATESRPPSFGNESSSRSQNPDLDALVLAKCGDVRPEWAAAGPYERGIESDITKIRLRGTRNSQGHSSWSYSNCAFNVRTFEAGPSATDTGGTAASPLAPLAPLVQQMVDQLKRGTPDPRLLESLRQQMAAAGMARSDFDALQREMEAHVSAGAPVHLEKLQSTLQDLRARAAPSALQSEFDVLDGLRAPAGNECAASVSVSNVRLNEQGTAVTFTLAPHHQGAAPCVVSFGVDILNGPRPLMRLPDRTVSVPPGGVTLQETALLPVPIQTSVSACARIEPTRQALLQKREIFADQYRMVQTFAKAAVKSLNDLERAVGYSDSVRALMALPVLVDAWKTILPPLPAAAVGGALCVGVEIGSFMGKAVASCVNPANTDNCVQDVLVDGASWAVKTVKCAAEETVAGINALDRLASAGETAYVGWQLLDLQRQKEATTDAAKIVVNSINKFAARMSQLQQTAAIVDATIGPLNQMCQSPRMTIVPVDIRSTPSM